MLKAKNNKIAYLFTGQGAQFIKMGEDLFVKNKLVQEIYKKANAKLDFSLSNFIFNGSSELLKQTKYVQPAIVAMQCGIVALLQEANIKPNMVAGLSLGEYSALYAAGAIDKIDLIFLVYNRGIIMDKVANHNATAAIIVLGLDDKVVEHIVKVVSNEDFRVEVANFNCPKQQVVVGHKLALARFKKLAFKKGAKKFLPLAVNVPSHTSFMKGAVTEFKKLIEKLEFTPLITTFYANVSGQKTVDSELKLNLLKQLENATYMGKIIHNMLDEGANIFVEIGPKKTLLSFVKKIAIKMNKEVQLICITDQASLMNAITILKQSPKEIKC